MATERNAGEAKVTLVPDATGFKKRAEADLEKIKVEFPAQATADTSRAATDLEAFRTREGRNAINLKVDVDTGRARAEVASLKKDLGSIGDELGNAFGAFGKLPFLSTGIFAGIGELPAATTAIVNVAGALQQLAGAGAAVPGIIGGVLASVGTVKLGILGVSDAYTALDKAADGSAKNVEAANKALAALAPSAREAVTTAHELAGELKAALVQPIQQNLFSGVSGDLRKLVDADLPVLKKGMTGIATALNGDLRQVLQSLGSDSSKGLLDRILGNTSDAQVRLQKAIDPLINGIGTLTAAGSDVLPRLADEIGKVAERFSAFITEADKNGTLSKFINDGITGFEHLGSAGVNIVKILNDITGAAGGDGGLLKFLDEGSQKLHDFLSSTEGQNKLKAWFEEGRREIEEHIIPILKSLPGFFEGLYNAGRTIADTVVPPLRDISKFLGEHPGLVTTAVGAFVAFKSITAVGDLASSLDNISKLLKVGLPAAAVEGSGAISAALAAVAVPAWLAAIVAAGGTAAYIAGTAGDSPRPGVPTPTDPTGQRGLQDRNTGTSIYGVPSVANDPIFNPHGPNADPSEPAPSRTGASTNDIPSPASRPTAPGYVPTPGAPAQQLPASSPGAPQATQPGPVGPVPQNPLLLPYGHANGGVLPGYSPGKDNMLVPMSGGEGVIIPTVTRQLGADGIAAINRGALTGGYAGGGIVDQFGNPVTPGQAPGGPAPVAPNPTGGGIIDSLFGGITSGIQGPIGNAFALGSSFANAGQQGGLPGVPSPGDQIQHGIGTLAAPGGAGTAPSFMDRLAGIPGIAGLIGSAGSSDPGANLMNWGEKTGQWLGNFTAKTVGGFATTLWQGGLDAIGLGGSILSPNNKWNQDAQSIGQFAFSSDGPLGQILGANAGAGSGQSGSAAAPKGPTDKQVREAGQKITRADQQVALIQQRIGELKPTASASQRQSLADQLTNAQQNAADARTDMGTLASGGSPSSRAGSTGSTTTAPAAGGNQGTVYQAMLAAGYPPSEWSALQNLLNGESGFRNTAQNPSSSAYGMFQFLDSTWSGAGGSKTSDPALQAQYGMQYIKQRYGSPSKAWSFWQAQSPHWYSGGGPARGPGGPKSDDIPAMLSNGEHVLTASDVNAMGGQGAVYAFRNALHRSVGGPIFKQGAIIWPKEPVGKTDKTRPGGVPDLDPGKSPGQIGLPDWGTPGQGFGPPPPGWWDKPVNPDDILNPEWMPPGQRDEWLDKWGNRHKRIKPLGYADGGQVIPPYLQQAQAISARQITPPPAPPGGFAQIPNANTKQLPAPIAAPPPQAAPAAPTPPPAPSQPAYTPTGAAPIAAAPSNDSLNHNLPAVSTGITSGASAIGQALSTAIGIAGGAAGGFGGGAIGAIGPYVAGLVAQGGKIVDNAVNVFSSFLVGNAPSATPYSGPTGVLRPQQNSPLTAQDNSRNYTFNGIDGRNIVDQMRLQDQVEQQAQLAQWRG